MVLGLSQPRWTQRGVQGLRDLDPGVQSGLTILGVLVFGAFALTVVGISQTIGKKKKR